MLGELGLCNPDTDLLLVSGTAGVGTVAFAQAAMTATATVTSSTLAAAQHSIGLLLVDAATGTPVSLDYGLATTTPIPRRPAR